MFFPVCILTSITRGAPPTACAGFDPQNHVGCEIEVSLSLSSFKLAMSKMMVLIGGLIVGGVQCGFYFSGS